MLCGVSNVALFPKRLLTSPSEDYSLNLQNIISKFFIRSLVFSILYVLFYAFNLREISTNKVSAAQVTSETNEPPIN